MTTPRQNIEHPAWDAISPYAMIAEPEWELKLADGNTATWHAPTAEAAATRYVDRHRGASVVATRFYMRHGFYPHVDIRRIDQEGR